MVLEKEGVLLGLELQEGELLVLGEGSIEAEGAICVGKEIGGDVLTSEGNASELVPDEFIVWLVLVLEALQVVEDVLHFFQVLGFDPQFLVWLAQALSLDVFHFLHGVFLLFSPLEFFIEEVKDDKVETPEVVSSGQVHIVVRV